MSAGSGGNQAQATARVQVDSGRVTKLPRGLQAQRGSRPRIQGDRSPDTRLSLRLQTLSTDTRVTTNDTDIEKALVKSQRTTVSYSNSKIGLGQKPERYFLQRFECYTAHRIVPIPGVDSDFGLRDIPV